MGICDTFRFNKKAYIRKVEKSDSSILRKKHHAKTRMLVACSISALIGSALAFHTFGASLFGTAYSIRQVHILGQQAAIIENEMISRGEEIPRCRKRDIASGVLIETIGMGVGVGIGGGIHHLIIDPMMSGHTVSHGATALAQQAPPTPSGSRQAVLNLPTRADGFGHGVVNAFSAEGHKVVTGVDKVVTGVHHVPNAAVHHFGSMVSGGASAAFVGGETLGFNEVISVEALAGKLTTKGLMERAIHGNTNKK